MVLSIYLSLDRNKSNFDQKPLTVHITFDCGRAPRSCSLVHLGSFSWARKAAGNRIVPNREKQHAPLPLPWRFSCFEPGGSTAIGSPCQLAANQSSARRILSAPQSFAGLPTGAIENQARLPGRQVARHHSPSTPSVSKLHQGVDAHLGRVPAAAGQLRQPNSSLMCDNSSPSVVGGRARSLMTTGCPRSPTAAKVGF